MKKLIWIGLTVFFFLLLSVSDIQASHRRCSPSQTYLTLSCFQNPKGVGLKHRLFDDIYVTGNMDYLAQASDLEFQAGALFVIPHKIIIFQFYGGAGLQFSRNLGYQYPYLTLGANFLFLFSEVIHPLEQSLEPRYRFGLSFNF